MRADDYIKYAAAMVRERIEWTTDEIGGACCGHGHDIPLDALMYLRADVEALAAKFGDINTYSDGRKVKTGTQIEHGVYTEKVWHPDPSAEKPHSWRGHLLSDPGIPSPGIYEVTTYPATQEIHVRVVRTA
ncbi:hypothetical protein [Mycobacterium sp. TY815]|uniref:hypothetical protein n=1 Tax=Mycobacterium sp. TY815 TaxID=3050581 RepID=UPI0027425F2F|nr:hypothetical protein [Mycobacterium sp. TY815]MDP7703238.1 hypothetical protein [Mycobacterium sp. TY815]